MNDSVEKRLSETLDVPASELFPWVCDDADVPQEDILAALRDATGEGFVAWVDVRAVYDRILSDR